jgi:acylphosphatase
MARTVLRLEIRGRVQGVGYRWAMVAGPPDNVDQLVAWARQGPRSAVVGAVDVFADEGSFDAFEQRPSV